MKGITRSVLMLPLLLCACGHKVDVTQVQPLAPPIEDAPPPKNDAATAANLTAPDVKTFPAPPPPKVVAGPKETPKKPKKKPVTKAPAAQPPVTPPAQASQGSQVAEAAPSEIPAIGTLTTGGEPDAQHKAASDAIADVEKRLSAINRKLSDPDEKTAADIREYLKQATAALNGGDVDGANNLCQKAKVLLGELTGQ
jgi:hypothetical protein